MNLLFTLTKGYLKYLFTLLRSLEASNDGIFNIYIISVDVKYDDCKTYFKYIDSNRFNFNIIKFDESLLGDAPTTKRYPLTMYYRLYAARLLPSTIDRVLYLDPDIIVLKDLSKLYNMPFCNNYFVACTNIDEALRIINEIKNEAPKKSPYPNTGVLLINLALLRKEQDVTQISEFIIKNKVRLVLPDQDVMHGLYGDKIKIVDHMIYNLSDRAISLYNLKKLKEIVDETWVEKNCCIIHYYGKNKPWKPDYKGFLNKYYDFYKID